MKIRHALPALGALALVAAAALPALADPKGEHHWREWHEHGFGPGAMRMFETFDRNGDGKITQDEVRSFREERLKAYDANGDGVLDLAEYGRLWLDAMRERMVRRFQMHDRDGDGKITREEFVRPGEAMFWRLDRNGDGVITREEVMGPKGPRPEWRERGPRPGPRPWEDEDRE